MLGGAAGLLAGVLLAPRSGKETRSTIADRAGEARERSRESYFDAQERMRERLSEAREGPRPRSETVDLGGGADPYPEETEADSPVPFLRDVSRDVGTEEPGDPAVRDAERSEELRRKVRETRERLRERGSGDPDPHR